MIQINLDIDSPQDAYDKAIDILPRRSRELAKIVASDAEYSYFYARDVQRGRFRIGESAIATHPRYSYRYSVDVLNNRFPAGELIILKSKYAKDYINKFLIPEEELIEYIFKYPIIINNIL